MASLSMIPWALSAKTPQELSSKMFDLNYYNQKNYQYSSPVFDNNLKEYITWYNVDVLIDKKLDGKPYEVTKEDIEGFLQAFKASAKEAPKPINLKGNLR